MGNPRNVGRAVPDAVRLNRCVELLQSEFTARIEQGWTCGPFSEWLAQAYAGDASRSDWLRRERAEHDAAWSITQAIRSGLLPVYAYFDDGPGLVDPDELGELAHRSLAAGAYQPLNDWSGEHAGRALWVKRADWTAFFAEVLCDLGGPMIKGVAQGNRSGTARAEAICTIWLRKRFEAGDEGRRDAMRARAQSEIPGLSERAFLRVWGTIAPEFGRDKLRRPKKSQH